MIWFQITDILGFAVNFIYFHLTERSNETWKRGIIILYICNK